MAMLVIDRDITRPLEPVFYTVQYFLLRALSL